MIHFTLVVQIRTGLLANNSQVVSPLANQGERFIKTPFLRRSIGTKIYETLQFSVARGRAE